MSADRKANRVEAVAVFHNVADLDSAVEALLQAGFEKEEVSLLASEDAVQAKLGHRYERVEELEDNPDAPRIAYRTLAEFDETERTISSALTYLPAVIAAGTVVASAGLVAGAITGTAIGGAVLSTVLARWIDKNQADQLQEQLEHGGLLLWVSTPTAEKQETALRILNEHAATHVHLHDFSAGGA